jgi:hypothetical protein
MLEPANTLRQATKVSILSAAGAAGPYQSGEASSVYQLPWVLLRTQSVDEVFDEGPQRTVELSPSDGVHLVHNQVHTVIAGSDPLLQQRTAEILASSTRPKGTTVTLKQSDDRRAPSDDHNLNGANLLPHRWAIIVGLSTAVAMTVGAAEGAPSGMLAGLTTAGILHMIMK